MCPKHLESYLWARWLHRYLLTNKHLLQAGAGVGVNSHNRPPCICDFSALPLWFHHIQRANGMPLANQVHGHTPQPGCLRRELTLSVQEHSLAPGGLATGPGPLAAHLPSPNPGFTHPSPISPPLLTPSRGPFTGKPPGEICASSWYHLYLLQPLGPYPLSASAPMAALPPAFQNTLRSSMKSQPLSPPLGLHPTTASALPGITFPLFPGPQLALTQVVISSISTPPLGPCKTSIVAESMAEAQSRHSFE